MNIFLDSSVLLAACESSTGASREIFNRSEMNSWDLVAIPYVIEEVERNMPKLRSLSRVTWSGLRGRLIIRENVLTMHHPVIFNAGKDRPILFSGLAYSQVLLTLDRDDFMDVLGRQFYGLAMMTPGEFLWHQRELGELQ